VPLPFTSWGGTGTVTIGVDKASSVTPDTTASSASAACCGLCERFSVSPTNVYSSRSSHPRSAAAASRAGESDLLLHDAHLVADELAAEASFGHSAANYSVGLAERAGARRVVLFHHKPERTDPELDELARSFEWAAVPVTVGAEGMIFDL